MLRDLRQTEKKEKQQVKSRPKLFISFIKTESFPEIDYQLKSAIRKGIEKTLEHENFPYPAEVSVTLCSEEHIHMLNLEYRGIDKPTDVLSFPLYENGNFPPDECLSGAMLGDIVISVPRVREQSAELGNSFVKETVFLAIHSTLHLLGYDHERSPEEDETQCRLQKKIIEAINI